MSKRDADAKKGADLLRSGATMLPQACPDCKVPLFKLSDGEIICPSCNRRVIFVKSTEVEKVVAESATTSQFEDDLQKKIAQIRERMVSTKNPEDLEKMAKALSSLFDLLEKVRRRKA
ncbi:MAG: hypothetical protein FJZ49_06575 [Candidatus Verstraetearchaeota archaeon]|nr:hypothetical protein [Candidatus Verstraetearchaeota archaeon]